MDGVDSNHIQNTFQPDVDGFYKLYFFNNSKLDEKEIKKRFSCAGEVKAVDFAKNSNKVYVKYSTKQEGLNAATNEELSDLHVRMWLTRNHSRGHKDNPQQLSGNEPHFTKYNKKPYNKNSNQNYSKPNSQKIGAENGMMDKRGTDSRLSSNSGSLNNSSQNSMCTSNSSLEKCVENSQNSVSVNSDQQITKEMDGDEASSEIPLLVNCNQQEIMEAMENLRVVDTTVVVIGNLPSWIHSAQVGQMVTNVAGIEPLHIDLRSRKKTTLTYYAYVHLRGLDEADACCKALNNYWCHKRRLICMLFDDFVNRRTN